MASEWVPWPATTLASVLYSREPSGTLQSFSQAYGYLPSQRASAPFALYRMTEACVWTTCQELLPSIATAGSQTRDLSIMSPTPWQEALVCEQLANCYLVLQEPGVEPASPATSQSWVQHPDH